MSSGAAGSPTPDRVEIYTDGACRGNPGPGGWAAILRARGREKEISGAESQTTNNRMELQAAIAALQALKRPVDVQLYTDSQYLRTGVLSWLPQWKARGWKTADRRDVKNQDLWQALDVEAAKHRIEWHWVRGHSGHPENERADALANAAIDSLLEVHSRSPASALGGSGRAGGRGAHTRGEDGD